MAQIESACRDICAQYGAHWVASNLVVGTVVESAALAQGDILWFLHVDVRLPLDHSCDDSSA